MSPAPDLLPVEAAEKLLAFAERGGVSREALFAAAGVADHAAPIPFAALCALYEQAARLTGDPDLGLHVGEATSPRMYGSLGYIAANSATLGEALASLASFQPLWTRAVGIELHHGRGSVSLVYWHKGAIPPEARLQESEQMLAALLAFARTSVAEPLRPSEVRFEHRAPSRLDEHRRIFAAPVRFSAPATELVFAADVLALPIPQADPTLARLLRDQARSSLAEQHRRDPFLDQLRRRTHQAMLEGGAPSLSDIAAPMKISARTLQRRLRAQGLSFRAVADEARLALAKTMLADPAMALSRIAFRLGYSQTSAFHRAFRRHTGTTPRAFRRALHADEDVTCDA